jgi:hypothetical protein
MDGWNGRYLSQCRFCFHKSFYKEKEKGAGRSTRRVLPWHDGGSEYLEGTTDEFEVVMFD